MLMYCPLHFNQRGKGHMQALIRIHFKTDGQSNSVERWQSIAAIVALVKAGSPVDPVVLCDAVNPITGEKPK